MRLVCSLHSAGHWSQGLYTHLANKRLTTRRDSDCTALHVRLTGPTQVGSSAEEAGACSVQFNADSTQLRQAVEVIYMELERRAGPPSRHPIYLVSG